MAFARHLQLATLDFLLGDTAPLAREDALLCMASAMCADGHRGESANVLTYIVGQVDDPEKVREAILQNLLFCGYPRALNGLEALESAMEKAGIPSDRLRKECSPDSRDNAELTRDGEQRFDAVYAANAQRVKDKMARLSPEIAAWSLQEAYGRILTRPLLSSLQREYCTVAALMMMDVAPQLKAHVQGSLNLGGTKEALWALYDTVKKLFEAPRLFDQVREVFESVLGKKPSGMSFEEEQQYRWS